MAIITIIVAGNGAHALAADCKLGGAEVRMFEFTRFNNKVKGILNSRRIRFEGIEKNHKNFKRNGKAGIYRILTPKPLVASKEEVESNPRARSAKLRIAGRE